MAVGENTWLTAGGIVAAVFGLLAAGARGIWVYGRENQREREQGDKWRQIAEDYGKSLRELADQLHRVVDMLEDQEKVLDELQRRGRVG